MIAFILFLGICFAMSLVTEGGGGGAGGLGVGEAGVPGVGGVNGTGVGGAGGTVGGVTVGPRGGGAGGPGGWGAGGSGGWGAGGSGGAGAGGSGGGTNIACEGSTLNLQCASGLINVIRVNYGRQSSTICNGGPANVVNCVSKNSFDIVNAKCDNKQLCSIEASNNVFGDPCVGTFKYLQVEYACINPRSTAKNALACETSNLNIKCGLREVIQIHSANYGRTSMKICNQHGPILTDNCVTPNSKTIVSKYCSGKQSCSIPATNDVFKDPCNGTSKYLTVDYVCIRLK